MSKPEPEADPDTVAAQMIADWRATVAVNVQQAAKAMCRVRCNPSCGCTVGWRTYMDLATALFTAGLLNLRMGPEN